MKKDDRSRTLRRLRSSRREFLRRASRAASAVAAGHLAPLGLLAQIPPLPEIGSLVKMAA